MAIGQIIGVGIMTMTGIAIGFTGRSVNIAYIVAGLLTIVTAIPQIYIGGTANFEGGQYSQIAVLGNKKTGRYFLFTSRSPLHWHYLCILYHSVNIFCRCFQGQTGN